MKMIYGLSFNSLTLIVVCLFVCKSQTKDTEYQSPIILIPGYGGNRLYAYSDTVLPSIPIHAWVNYFFILFPKLLTHIMKLSYDEKSHTTHNTNGFTLKVPGWGDTYTIEQLDYIHHSKTTYLASLVEHILKSPFYKRNFTLRGAPYDFRKAPNELGLYFSNLKLLVEETYKNAGDRKVVIFGHSLGCLHALYFLKIMPFAWKKQYLKAYLSVSGPYGGSIDDLILETNGVTFVETIDSMHYRDLERSFPSSSFLFPSESCFGSEPLVMTKNRNYSALQYRELFNDMEFKDGYLMYEDVKDLIQPAGNLTDPEELYCVHGSGLETPSSFFIENFNGSKPIVTYKLGDGVVTPNSLEICKSWGNVNHVIIEGQDHSGILQNSQFLEIFDKILSKP